MDQSHDGQNQEVGDQDDDALVPLQEREGRDMGRIPYKMLQRSQEDLDKDGFIPFCTKLLLKACGELWDGCVIRDPMLSSLP